jgi:hypothetical protein
MRHARPPPCALAYRTLNTFPDWLNSAFVYCVSSSAIWQQQQQQHVRGMCVGQLPQRARDCRGVSKFFFVVIWQRCVQRCVARSEKAWATHHALNLDEVRLERLPLRQQLLRDRAHGMWAPNRGGAKVKSR